MLGTHFILNATICGFGWVANGGYVYDIVKLHAHFKLTYLFLYTGMNHQIYFIISFFVGDFIFLMDCVFMVKLFHHMEVTGDKISGRRTLISMT